MAAVVPSNRVPQGIPQMNWADYTPAHLGVLLTAIVQYT